MPTATRSLTLRRLSVVGVLVGLLALGACGGDDSSAGVASLEAGDSTETTTKDAASSGDAEAELQKWVECMRENGIDIPDPTTDDEGNLTLRPPEGGAAGGPSTDSPSSEGGQTQELDGESMDAAREECGDPPEGAMGGFDRGNSQEFQDAALVFAQCMRDNGVDMPDPVFEEPSADGARPEGGPRMFDNGGLDPDDPAVEKAMEACRSVMPEGPGGGPQTRVGSGGDATDSSSASEAG